MIQILYSWIKNIVIFMIFRTLVINMLPSSSYKKYVNIFSGLILIIIVISPFNKNLDSILNMRINEEIFKINEKEQEINFDEIEKSQFNETSNQYKQTIISQLKKIVEENGCIFKEGTVVFEDNIDSLHYGNIYEVSISISPNSQKSIEDNKLNQDKTKQNRKSNDNITVETIEQIEVQINNNQKSNESYTIETNTIKKIKNSISSFYNLSNENIHINIQG